MFTSFPTTFRFFELLKQTARILGKNWRFYTMAVIVFSGITEIMNYVFLTSAFEAEYLVSPRIFLQQEFYGTGIIGIVAMTFLSALIMHLTLATLTEKQAPWRAHVQKIGGLLGVLLGTLILKALILVGAFALFIIPGFIWLNYYTFSDQFVLSRGLKFKQALDASKSMVRGRWWEILGVNLVVVLYAGILQTTISAIGKNIFSLPENGWQEIPVFILSTWLTSISIIFLTLYFHHLQTTLESEVEHIIDKQ